MRYTEKLRIDIPTNVYDIACSITRTLDPDVGGADSWTPVYGEDGETITSYFVETPCTPSFKEQAVVMLHDPAMLHAVVSSDFEKRWVDLIPPKLEEIEMFCALAVIAPDPIEEDSHGL